ncbi:hypothetical protein [Bordetella genomosp. 9]|uniref:Lipoprotein n=1 Tax=Bordetella genomosp. 9 TaxID=1416803 RepID=A0A1W6YYF2_9BORD|nr:hypothetical protein [Bordetella genomosp. 9]ARP86021.1 hypothetical protein CAL13_07255 [Bordetella genomosp. 9]ARP90044.1 hypothetical protein CAL14_06855 [Bordetella genomosp. 9]
MKTIRSALPLVLLVAACAVMAGCADGSSRRAGSGPYNAPAPTTPSNDMGSRAGGSRPALSIQAGEGEKLYLPWFINDVAGWVNARNAPDALERPPGTP